MDLHRPTTADEIECAVVIPCRNEELTVERVVRDFRAALPRARIVVFDNASTDRTAEVAARAGATVLHEKRPGKGHVVAAMLARVDADVYVMVDGDATYPAAEVRALLEPILRGEADHVIGARAATVPDRAYRRFHTLGNRLVTWLVNRVFGSRLGDVMSGYRAFTREVADTVPLLAAGFDVETEFTLQCLEKGFVLVERPVPYRERPAGSVSKLATFRDGARVLARIVRILKDFRPFAFFGALAVGFAALSLLAGWLPILEYVRERYVHRVPLAILAAGLGVISISLLVAGTILSTINARFRELHALRRRDSARPRRST